MLSIKRERGSSATTGGRSSASIQRDIAAHSYLHTLTVGLVSSYNEAHFYAFAHQVLTLLVHTLLTCTPHLKLTMHSTNTYSVTVHATCLYSPLKTYQAH